MVSILKYVRLGFVGVVLVVLTACGGGSGGGDEPIIPTNSDDPITAIDSINGIVQLGYIVGGTVSIFDLSDLTTPIATVKTSSSLLPESAGKFTIENIVISDSKYYLLTVTGGKDIDVNDDGSIDVSTQVDLNGTIHTLATGTQLKAGVRINALSDMVYQKIQGIISTASSTQIMEVLDNSAKEYLFDINGDAKVDYKDILAFNPVKHTNNTKKSYKDILDIYVEKLHNNESEEKIFSSLMYLDAPRIIVENGNLQEVPFALNATLENEPKGLSIKWFLDNTEKPSINETMTDDGVYQVMAKIYKDDILLKTVISTVIATDKVEISSVDVDVIKDSEIFVTDESNSSLAGTRIFIPQGALSENTKIVVKKASVNVIPTENNSMGITDVLVLQPSGLTFAKPVQIRLPYDASINLDDHQVRIARYSEGGEIDYIVPLYIDKENHEIVFETDHFTEFKAETDFIGESDDKKFINALNQEFPNLQRDIDEWKPILNVPIEQEYKKITVYDYLKTYIENKRVYTFIKQSGVLLDDGTIDYANKYAYPYISALKYLYPDSSDYSRAMLMWSQIKPGFEVIDYIGNVGGTVLNLAKGEIFVDFIETVLGIPTSSSNLSFYSPKDVAEGAIKVVVDLDNNGYIESLIYNVYIDENGQFNYDNQVEQSTKDFLDENGIRWMAEDMVRRYKNYESDSEEHFNKAQNIIDEAVAYLDNQEKTEYYKKNTDSSFDDYPASYRYPKSMTLKKGEKLKLSIKIKTQGYDENSFKPVFELTDYDNNTIEAESNSYIVKWNFEKIDDYNGVYTADLEFKPVNSGKYMLRYYIREGFNKLNDDFDTVYYDITITEPKYASITDITLKGSLSADGESYLGLITAKFDVNPSLPYEIILYYNGENIGKVFKINKDDFNDDVLSRLIATVHVSDDARETYSVDDEQFDIDIKAKIAQALLDREDNTEPEEEIIPELRVTSSVDIEEGNTVSFSLDMSNVMSIGQKRFGTDSIDAKIEDNTYLITCTYNNEGTYSPEIQVKLKSGSYMYIKAATVHVNKALVESETNHIPTVTTKQSATVSEGTVSYITLEAYDADSDDTLTYVYGQPIHGKLTGTGPTITYTPDDGYVGSDSFVFTVTDGTDVSKEAIVELDVRFVEKRFVSYYYENDPKDSCLKYDELGCEQVIEKGQSFSKEWQLKNTGNVALSGVKVVPIASSTNSALTISLKSPMARSLAINESGSYKIDITVPSDARAGVHKALYKLVDENGDLKYANGNVAYFWYKFSVLEDVPSLTLVDVATASKNTIFTFEATLLEPLKEIYTVQISLGDNGGGYLEPQEMIANANRDSFALARNIGEAGNRVYKVAIFKDDIRVSDWVEGSYVVSTITDIPTNLTVTQNATGVTLGWDAVTGAESYVLMRSLDGILFGNYDETTGITTNGYFFDASHFVDGEILYFSVGVTGGEQSEKVSIIWEPSAGVPSLVSEDGGNDRDALISPNGGEVWTYGKTQAIEWMTQYITGEKVDLYVLHDSPDGLFDRTSQTLGTVVNSKTWYKFATNVQNNGNYDVDPSNMNGIGNAYMVLVVSTTDNTKWDISDAMFTLANNGTTTTQLKKTGQTTVYHTGDDGSYQAGVTPSYTRDDASEVVTDHITGLEWQDDEEAKTITKTWADAQTYCTSLGLDGGGWRLPSRKELVGLSDYGRTSPAINPVFFNVVSNGYWSSTTYAGVSGIAWFVYFSHGNQSYNSKSFSGYVRCVRAGQ